MAPYTNPGCFWRRFKIVVTCIPFSSSSRSWVVGASHLRRGRERDARAAGRALGDAVSRRSSRYLRSEMLSHIHSWVRCQPTDSTEDPEKICDRILSEIRRSQFMIADFTKQRPGVYFEAGFAMGLGRPVVWTCREDDVASLHFDTRQYNHVLWT